VSQDVRRTDNMGLLAKFFGVVPREEREGIHLDLSRPFWEVSGKTDFPSLLSALPNLLSGECVLYFEGGAPSKELAQFLREHSVSERAHVAYGTIWPRPSVLHLPATPQTMRRLTEMTRSCAYPELAIHFHVYRGQSVLLEWHDAFTQPMLLSGELPEHKVRTFAEGLSMSYKKGVEPSAAPNGGPATQLGNSGVTEGPPSVS
jgi:hypothetical protein